MKVLVDMNLSTDWAQLLVEAGHGATHWSSLAHPAAGDDELIEWAADHNAVILTNDLDFGITLVTNGLNAPSVVQLRSRDLRPSTLGVVVLRALDAYAEELARGVLLTIDPTRARARFLSLRNTWD